LDADVLVRDYMGRLAASAAGLSVQRRAELTDEVREHIDAAIAEAGRSDEATVRNILDRLGPPDEIVAAEAVSSATPQGAAPAPPVAGAGNGERWGPIEVSAVVLLVLAWPSVFLPFGPLLWLALGSIGLVLVWLSGAWSTRRKVTSTACVVALYVLLFLVLTPLNVQCTTGNPAQPCPPGGPSPVVSSS